MLEQPNAAYQKSSHSGSQIVLCLAMCYFNSPLRMTFAPFNTKAVTLFSAEHWCTGMQLKNKNTGILNGLHVN